PRSRKQARDPVADRPRARPARRARPRARASARRACAGTRRAAVCTPKPNRTPSPTARRRRSTPTAPRPTSEASPCPLPVGAHSLGAAVHVGLAASPRLGTVPPTTVRWTKGHGTENDFVLLLDPDGHTFADLDAETVRLLCDRRRGIGAD